MFKWIIECRKHQLVGLGLLVWSVVILGMYLGIDNMIIEIVWVFSVILLSAAALTYCAVILFQFVALKDTLLQLSNSTERAKTYLKIIPLSVGLLVISLVMLSGYLFTDLTSHGTASEYLLTYGAKIVSILSFVSLVWLCAKATNFVSRFKTGIFVALLIIAIIVYVVISWNLYGLTEDNWYVASQSQFGEFPVYFNVLPVMIVDPSMNFTQMTAISTGLNLIPVVLFMCLSYLQRNKTIKAVQ